VDKFINLDFRPDSNRKLALRLKHVTKRLIEAIKVTAILAEFVPFRLSNKGKQLVEKDGRSSHKLKLR